LNSTSLSKAYKSERDVHIKERLLLIIRISSDKQPVESVSQELHRARSWAYKWYKRYNDEGLEGLRDRPRSGKPSIISKDVKEKIRYELYDSNIGWDIKQVMDLIQQKTGVKYHKEHIRRLLHKWGFSPKVPQKRFVRTATRKEKKKFKKGYNKY
jgi:putative transposase